MQALQLISEWSSIGVLVIQGVFALVLWSLRKTFAPVEDCAKLEQRVTETEARLDSLPLPADTNPLLVSLAALQGDIKTLSAKVDAQAKATDRLEGGMDLLTQHHLNRSTS